MKVALISPYSSITSLGVRLLSACLKEAGHEVKLVFAPAYPKAYARIRFKDKPYREEALASLSDLCSDCGLIGVSLMTNFFQAAVQITETLHERIQSPIIWGGIHPTVCPEQCLQHADLICVGEGEEALPELAERLANDGSAEGIHNIWSRKDGEIQRTSARPWVQNPADFPILDSFVESHYAITADRSKIVPIDEKLKVHHLMNDATSPGAPYYQTTTTRGCPRNCTYCGNSAFRLIGGAKGYCRTISTDWVMKDLHLGVEKYNPHYIIFDDECLSCRTLEDIEEFSERYRKEIGLPFRAMATPPSITEAKMECLVAAGLAQLEIGVQSASPRILELYERTWANAEKVAAAAKIVTKHKAQMTPIYDFIIDNPYETSEDTVRSAWLIRDLPRPALFQIFSLMLYPGTEIAIKAEKDGLVDEEHYKAIYQRHYMEQKPSYCNLLCSIAVRQPPRWLFRLLTSRTALFLFDRRWLEPVYWLLYKAKRTFVTARDRRRFRIHER